MPKTSAFIFALRFLIFLGAFSSPALADRWEEVGRAIDGTVFYLDTTTVIRQDRNTVVFWVRTVTVKGESERMRFVMFRNRTYSLLGVASGDITPEHRSDRRDIAPESMIETFYYRLFRE